MDKIAEYQPKEHPDWTVIVESDYSDQDHDYLGTWHRNTPYRTPHIDAYKGIMYGGDYVDFETKLRLPKEAYGSPTAKRQYWQKISARLNKQYAKKYKNLYKWWFELLSFPDNKIVVGVKAFDERIRLPYDSIIERFEITVPKKYLNDSQAANLYYMENIFPKSELAPKDLEGQPYPEDTEYEWEYEHGWLHIWAYCCEVWCSGLETLSKNHYQWFEISENYKNEEISDKMKYFKEDYSRACDYAQGRIYDYLYHVHLKTPEESFDYWTYDLCSDDDLEYKESQIRESLDLGGKIDLDELLGYMLRS